MSLSSWLNEFQWKTKTALLKSHKSFAIQIWGSVTRIATMPVNDRLAPSPHAVDQSGDTLLWDGIPLNLQKMGQVSQGLPLELMCLVHRTWALAHCIRACLCRSSTMAFFTRRRARSPALCKHLLIVCTETLWRLGGRSPFWISVAEKKLWTFGKASWSQKFTCLLYDIDVMRSLTLG